MPIYCIMQAVVWVLFVINETSYVVLYWKSKRWQFFFLSNITNQCVTFSGWWITKSILQLVFNTEYRFSYANVFIDILSKGKNIGISVQSKARFPLMAELNKDYNGCLKNANRFRFTWLISLKATIIGHRVIISQSNEELFFDWLRDRKSVV